MWYQPKQGCQLFFSGKYYKLHYNTDACILLPPNLTTCHFSYNLHKCHTMTLPKDSPIMHYDANIRTKLHEESVIKKKKICFPATCFALRHGRKGMTTGYRTHYFLQNTTEFYVSTDCFLPSASSLCSFVSYYWNWQMALRYRRVMATIRIQQQEDWKYVSYYAKALVLLKQSIN